MSTLYRTVDPAIAIVVDESHNQAVGAIVLEEPRPDWSLAGLAATTAPRGDIQRFERPARTVVWVEGWIVLDIAINLLACCSLSPIQAIRRFDRLFENCTVAGNLMDEALRAAMGKDVSETIQRQRAALAEDCNEPDRLIARVWKLRNNVA